MESLAKYNSDDEETKSKDSEPRASRETDPKHRRGYRERSQHDSDSSQTEDERKPSSRRQHRGSRSKSPSRPKKADQGSGGGGSSYSKHSKKKRRVSRDSRKRDRRSPRRNSRDRSERGRRDSREREDRSRRDRDRRRSRDRSDRKKDHDRDDRHKEKAEHRRRIDRRSRERTPERNHDRKEVKPAPHQPSPHQHSADDGHNGSDDRNAAPAVSNSTSALRKAEAINRMIERRAQEKMQQLHKLGITIPALMSQQIQPPPLHLLPNHTTGLPSLMNAAAVAGSCLAGVAQPPQLLVLPPPPPTENENLTLNLSNFTSSVLANAKYTEQMQKKKLIWGSKKAPADTSAAQATNNKWEQARFSQDNEGKVASKFLRLMGMKNAPAAAGTAAAEAPAPEEDTGVKQREQMFSSMEQQYEIARAATHTMRGMGLGFGSQSRPC